MVPRTPVIPQKGAFFSNLDKLHERLLVFSGTQVTPNRGTESQQKSMFLLVGQTPRIPAISIVLFLCMPPACSWFILWLSALFMCLWGLCMSSDHTTMYSAQEKEMSYPKFTYCKIALNRSSTIPDDYRCAEQHHRIIMRELYRNAAITHPIFRLPVFLGAFRDPSRCLLIPWDTYLIVGWFSIS